MWELITQTSKKDRGNFFEKNLFKSSIKCSNTAGGFEITNVSDWREFKHPESLHFPLNRVVFENGKFKLFPTNCWKLPDLFMEMEWKNKNACLWFHKLKDVL